MMMSPGQVDPARQRALDHIQIVNVYDFDLGTVLTPYIIQHTPRGFCSGVVNTDDYGFRISYDTAGAVDSRTWFQRNNRGLVIGNSFVFGKGASTDRATLVSKLNQLSGSSFMNLGVMAGNSIQELIAAIPFLEEAEHVLICSGLVNLFLNLRRDTQYDLYGAFYAEDVFAHISNIDYRILKSILTDGSDTNNSERRSDEQSDSVSREHSEAVAELSAGDLQVRMNRALDMHRRDLELILTICRPSTPVLFALQPFSSLAKPCLSPEEKILFDHYNQQGKVWVRVLPYGKKLWQSYTDALNRMCSELNVPFTDLNTLSFNGWCFIDPVTHMCDNGYDQAACFLNEWMRKPLIKRGGGTYQKSRTYYQSFHNSQESDCSFWAGLEPAPTMKHETLVGADSKPAPAASLNNYEPINRFSDKDTIRTAAQRAADYIPIWAAYDAKLSTVLSPYMMRHTPAGFRSDIVNTDDFGFRFSHDREGIVDSHSWRKRKKRGVVLGNSYVLSFGVTSDRKSLVSVINESGEYSFMNLGILAGNSTQEFIASIPFLLNTHCVLICSGLLNLLLNLRRLDRYTLYGPFEGEELFAKLGKLDYRTIRDWLKKPVSELRADPIFKSIRGSHSIKKEPDSELTPEEIEIRFHRAVALHQRDLQMIVRVCHPDIPVYFALQPLSYAAKPLLTEEETLLFDHIRQKKVWRKVYHYLRLLWERYSQSLRQICEDLKVPFTNINDLKFDGWCFLDPAHMTDQGHRQTGQFLSDWMRGAPC